jgi:hypothetical protein
MHGELTCDAVQTSRVPVCGGSIHSARASAAVLAVLWWVPCFSRRHCSKVAQECASSARANARCCVHHFMTTAQVRQASCHTLAGDGTHFSMQAVLNYTTTAATLLGHFSFRLADKVSSAHAAGLVCTADL